MEKSFITIGGKEYRVEVNWNALVNYLAAVGRDSLEGLSEITNMKATDITPLMAAAINEGERLEGHDIRLTALDLGAMIRPLHVNKFMEIYIHQSAAALEAEKEEKKSQGGE